MQWSLVDDGATIGTIGTEGEIVQDHHLPGEARTTLERRNNGYAITAGIYGWMVCTIFLDEDEIEQLYSEVQRELQRIVVLIPFEEEATTEAMERVTDEIRKFVARYQVLNFAGCDTVMNLPAVTRRLRRSAMRGFRTQSGQGGPVNQLPMSPASAGLIPFGPVIM